MDQLYVMELLVNQIVFPSLPVPQKKQIIVQAKCGSFANLEIRTDVMGTLETQERSERRIDLDIGCGKSLLFAISPATLKKTLKESPLEISVSTKLQTEPMGTASIPWSAEFLDMVESTLDSLGYVTPVELRDQIPLMNNGNPAGSIDIYLRLTFLGRNIDTHIQVTDSKGADGRPGGTAKQFLFKSNNNATTFQCQKYGLGSDTDVIPVAPIYRTAVMNIAPTQNTGRNINQSVISIMGKYASMASIQSVVPSVFKGMSKSMVNPNYGLTSSSPSDTQSLKERIPDKLFMNLQDMGQNISSISATTSDIDMENLTVAQIEKLLCKCKRPDCPAAKLFKNYGIGPLAKGNALGAMNCEIEAPISYGLSHLNGRIDNYGPLGTYSRPKSPSQSFIPKGDICTTKSNSQASCCSCKSGKNGEPLRLKGGGPISGGSDKFPDPKNACQDLMDEFNRLLNDYKNALGPCGQATCPFAHNLVADNCKKICNPEPGSSPNTLPCGTTPAETMVNNKPKPRDDELAACALSDCPYRRDIINPADKDHKKSQLKSACGSPTCPFMREKYGIEDDPEFPPMPCAGKACPFKVPKDLPPIHWDCPEPLPKGQCKNPNCPLVNKDKIVNKYFPEVKSPCGSPACPFAVVPCTFPGCPFAEDTPLDPCPPICPYTEPVPKLLKCTSSTCPFAESKTPNICDNENCPYATNTGNTVSTTPPQDTCANETCPYSKKTDKIDSAGLVDNSKNVSGEPCTNTTCVGFGGNLVCQECGDTIDVSNKNFIQQKEIVAAESNQGDTMENKKIDSSEKSKKKKSEVKNEEVIPTGEIKKKRKRKKRRRCGYVYDEGTYYPGTKVGHRFCVLPKFNVPPDMGWLWNVHTKCMSLRPRRGWKPGAIGRTIAAMIDLHRKKLGMDPITEKGMPKHRRKGLGGKYGEESSEEDVPLKPTLQVKKKDGVVYVTMNPLKDPKTLEDNENPYMDCSPMQFKIVKNKQKDFKMCYCGEENEEDVDVSGSSSSELDIEFTPPAGIIRPERLRKKKNICHTDTQYNIADCAIAKKDTDGKKKGKGKDKGKKGKKGKS